MMMTSAEAIVVLEALKEQRVEVYGAERGNYVNVCDERQRNAIDKAVLALLEYDEFSDR